jgi:fatty-acyl-CoA synthase
MAFTMGSAVPQLDRKAAIEAQALGVVQQVLGELGGSRGLEELAARGPAAHLERELGLGSLERVELMLRLGDACGVRLPDRVVAEADTVQDLIDAILREESQAAVTSASSSSTASSVNASSARAKAVFLPSTPPDLAEKIRSAATLTEILRLRGRGEPARAHIFLYEEDHDDPREITFGELYERAAAVAVELQRRGLEPGQTVAIMLPTCAEFFFTFAGVLLAGGIPVPIYPPIRADRVTEYAARQSGILRNAEARFLITFRQAEGLARLLQPSVPTLRGVLNAERLASVDEANGHSAKQHPATEWRAVQNLSHQPHTEDIALLQYTSGSTGDPKGVTLTHANLLSNIRSIVAGIDLRPDDVAVSWLPLYHDMGLIGAWFVPLFSGVPLIAMSPLAFLSRPERWLRAIHRHRGTISPAPNFAYELCVRKIAEKDLQELDLSSWRAAWNGAEPVHPGTLQRFATRFAPCGFRREALLPVYGLAEASLGISVSGIGSGYRVDRIERDAFESSRRAIPTAASNQTALEFVGAGKPLPDVEVRIVDAEGLDLAERVEGQLWFRSPAATSGYYRNPAATREIMREGGWLNSGDYAYLADGEIYITARAKDVIIKGGRNLYPHEIEQVAGRVEGVRTGCVVAFGAPDARSGTEKLIVAAEVRGRGAREGEKRISDEIARVVNEAMGVPPDQIELLAPQSIPKTSSGKLRRSEARRLFLAGELGKKTRPAWMQIAALGVRGALPRAWTVFKSGVRTVGETVYGVYALVAFVLVLIPLWLAVLPIRDPRKASRIIQRAARLMLSVAHIPVNIQNDEILRAWTNSGPWIFAPNHSSYLDIVALVAFLPANVRYVVKGEALQMPFLGLLVRRGGQFAFDRSDPEARIEQAREVNAALELGESVVIYPEGTFTAVAGLRPFQLGAFKAAADTLRPICPVAVCGARQMLRDGTYLPRPGGITMVLGPLVAPDAAAGANWQEVVRLRDVTREIIGRNAGEPIL